MRMQTTDVAAPQTWKRDAMVYRKSIALVAAATVLGLSGATVGAESMPRGKLLIGRYFPASKQADLFIVRPSGASSRLTKTKAFESSAVFSPNRRRIAFVRRSPDKTRFSLMVMRGDGTGVKRVARGAGTGVTWSPDGNWITYVRLVDGGAELAVVSPDGEQKRVLAMAPFIYHLLDWAPDSSRIVFSQRLATPAEGGNLDVYSVRPDGTDLTQLTESPADDVGPSFSPDGSRIVFSTQRDDPHGDAGPLSSELYVMNADGSDEVALTNTLSTWDEQPQWAPKGNLIVYQRRYDDDLRSGLDSDIDILVINVETGRKRPLTTDRRADDRAPLWSPDGRWVAFERQRGSNDSEVYIVRVDREKLLRLTDNRKPDDGVSDWFMS